MKNIGFIDCAKRMAYVHVYGYATMLSNAGIIPDFEYLLTDAIHDIREFTVCAEIHHGIVLEMTPAVLDAIEQYARAGWRVYLASDRKSNRIESLDDLIPFASHRRRLEMVTDSAFYIHQGKARQLIVLPISSEVFSVKLTYLDCMDTLIKESK